MLRANASRLYLPAPEARTSATGHWHAPRLRAQECQGVSESHREKAPKTEKTPQLKEFLPIHTDLCMGLLPGPVYGGDTGVLVAPLALFRRRPRAQAPSPSLPPQAPAPRHAWEHGPRVSNSCWDHQT